ncbi:hypothetical protein LHYA1_G005365 [Lachnellula hyalina]|uniref:Uncharacterized protein n=1 Tax=Lachnellula hyalina TaxID=1316788 RepID=A0A8H8R2C1_9HELO|nr:uncharacterized protein LHYA1_G005365 [Lachnellula hyalina]TVY26175.1 hypothetical protein LHYA1_G005365 [Lachnellula hyalina]
MGTVHTLSDLRLERMPQLAEAKGIHEDWTGIGDAETRRKLQNRLNVRAHRKRKAAQSQAPALPAPATDVSTVCWDEDHQTVTLLPAQLANTIPRPPSPLIPPMFRGTPTYPTTRIVFPLTSDHLITLVQYNVLRAAMTNLRLLSALHTVPSECSQALRIVPVPTTNATTFSGPDQPVPPSLEPTPLQRAVTHDKWINILPHAVWRDNCILAAGTYDSNDMRRDFLGGLWEGFPGSEAERRGLIAWSTPWEISGWEVSEGFIEKWGWLLKGCKGVMEATNRWRALRGEEPVVIEI